MKKITIIAAALLMVGCAHYRTTQSDTSYDEKGLPQRTIKTEVSVGTLFDSSSKLATSKAIQTDKSQSSALGGLDQGSSTTNAVLMMHDAKDIITSIMAKAP